LLLDFIGLQLLKGRKIGGIKGWSITNTAVAILAKNAASWLTTTAIPLKRFSWLTKYWMPV